VNRRRLVVVALLAVLCAVAAQPALASPYKPTAPFLAHTRATLPSGKPAAGASVTLYPDPLSDRRKVVLHAAWKTTTTAKGRFTLRAMFRSHVVRAAASNDNWVNFIVFVTAAKRAGFWEFPAHWARHRWHVEAGSMPASIVLDERLTPRQRHHG
jgi:hypothetical protein